MLIIMPQHDMIKEVLLMQYIFDKNGQMKPIHLQVYNWFEFRVFLRVLLPYQS